MCLAVQGTVLRTTGSSPEELRRVPQCGAIHPPYPTRMDPRDALTEPRDAAPAPNKTFVLSGLRGWGRAPPQAQAPRDFALRKGQRVGNWGVRRGARVARRLFISVPFLRTDLVTGLLRQNQFFLERQNIFVPGPGWQVRAFWEEMLRKCWRFVLSSLFKNSLPVFCVSRMFSSFDAVM